MKYFTPEYWLKFINHENKFNGILFEKLIHKILTLHYGGKWHITKVSWDGGKDIVTEEFFDNTVGWQKNNKIWAECKIHKKPISLRLVSNSLVMALLDQASKLMIFSYSPIVDNARLQLARYGSATGIGVDIVDDELLEQLIICNIIALKDTFFPILPIKLGPKSYKGKLKVIPRLTKDIETDPLRLEDEVEYSFNDPKSMKKTINLRSILRIQVAIHNQKLDKLANVNIILEGADPLISPFELINKDSFSIKKIINPQSLAFFEYYFRPNSAGKLQALPKLLIFDSTKKVQTLELGNINIRNILVPPLIGSRFHDFKETFNEKISLRTKPIFTIINGKSGVGKSRLSLELTDVLISTGRDIHKLDGSSNSNISFDSFVRQLLASLYRLPDFSIYAKSPKDIKTHTNFKENVSPTLQNILYDLNLDVTKHVDTVLELAKKAINTSKVGLIIDNVQYLDAATINFLSKFVLQYHNTASILVCIFIFNSDYLNINSQALRFQKLLSYLRVDDNEHVLICNLSDLTKSEINLFIDHMISIDDGNFKHGFTSKYPFLTELLHNKIIPRPLHLIQTIFYLWDQEALIRKSDFLYIDDIELLHSLIRTTPPTLKELIRKRWHRILLSHQHLEHLIILLSLLRSIRYEDKDHFNIMEDDWEALISLGLAKENEISELVFFHEQLEWHFVKEYEKIDVNIAKFLVTNLKEKNLDTIYFPSYFIVSVQSNSITNSTLQRAYKYLRKGTSFSNLNITFGENFRYQIRNKPQALSPRKELQALQTLIILVSAFKGLQYRLSVYNQEVDLRKRNIDRYKTAAHEFITLLRDHASCYFGTHEDTKALQLLKEADILTKEFSFPTVRAKDISVASLSNRLCVAYKSLGDRESALNFGKKALKLAKKNNAYDLIFLSYVDLGYVYYGSQKPSSNLLNYWENAIECFDSHEYEINRSNPDNTPCANLIKAHLLMLNGELESAGILIDTWSQRCMNKFNGFYGVSFLLLQIVRNLLLVNPKSRLTLIRGLIDMTVDTCMTYNVSRSYWKVLYALGKVELLADNIDKAITAYQSSFHQLLKVTNTSSELLYKYFFEDFVVTCKKNNIDISKDISKLRNPKNRHNLENILNSNTNDFRDYCNRYIPCSTYNDGISNFPCP